MRSIKEVVNGFVERRYETEWTAQADNFQLFKEESETRFTIELPLTSERSNFFLPEAENTINLFNRYTPSKIEGNCLNSRETLERLPETTQGGEDLPCTLGSQLRLKLDFHKFARKIANQ